MIIDELKRIEEEELLPELRGLGVSIPHKLYRSFDDPDRREKRKNRPRTSFRDTKRADSLLRKF